MHKILRRFYQHKGTLHAYLVFNSENELLVQLTIYSIIFLNFPKIGIFGDVTVLVLRVLFVSLIFFSFLFSFEFGAATIDEFLSPAHDFFCPVGTSIPGMDAARLAKRKCCRHLHLSA